MAFLTGLVQLTQLNASKGALTPTSQTEPRHEVWSLIDIRNTNPFAGPIDTVYPYANQILDITNVFVVPGSCPKVNPVFPNPRQGLPQMSYANNTRSLKPGGEITFTFTESRTSRMGGSIAQFFFSCK